VDRTGPTSQGRGMMRQWNVCSTPQLLLDKPVTWSSNGVVCNGWHRPAGASVDSSPESVE
jgi:hypothetical protein